MAQGDSKVFNDFALKLGQGSYNLSSAGLSISFVADTYASVDQNASNPNISGFTPLSGGNYSASTALSGITWGRSGNVATLDYANLSVIAQNASNPTTIRTALIHFTSGGDLYKAVDLTTDGSTAIDAVNGDLTYTVNAAGSSTLTVS